MSTQSPSDSAKGGAVAGTSTGGVEDDWRSDIEQSFRNDKAREIASVLASLEPGVKSSSKLRLAMQLEDTIFKAASSLDEYNNRLAKRLRKVQKSYKPPVQNDETKDAVHKEREMHSLRSQYSDTIKYILKHSKLAVQELKDKHGDDKATQLKQHTDVVQLWASELGLLDPKNTKPNMTISIDQLKKLKDGLERKLDNIRFHVIKLAEPDKWMSENLEKVEKSLSDKLYAGNLLAELSRKRFEHIIRKKLINIPLTLQQSVDNANRQVPVPTVRNNTQQNDERVALIHLDKMRSASAAVYSYLACTDKHINVPKNNCLSRMNTVATDGVTFIKRIMTENRKQQKPEQVSLQDAWMKPLVLPTPTSSTDDTIVDPDITAALDFGTNSTVVSSATSAKRIRLSNTVPIITRSRVLLTPNRKVPTSLVRALKSKRATLIRPPPIGQGTYLTLEFGAAFVMYIYLVPLVVTIRAIGKRNDTNDDNNENNDIVDSSETTDATTTKWSCTRYLPLHHGLENHLSTTIPPSSATSTSTSSVPSSTTTSFLTVYGVSGSYETIGSIVEERLRDCSAHATYTLRKCFSKHVKTNFYNNDLSQSTKSDFEIEICEASALLEFLHIARTTYTPNWEDDDTF